MGKNLSIGALALFCIAVLVVGNIHWNQKTTVTATTQHSPEEPDQTTQVAGVEKEQKQSVSNEDVEALLSNWPDKAKQQFMDKMESGQPYTIVMAGSDALQAKKGGWPALLKEQLEISFGKDRINIVAIETESHSLDYVRNKEFQKIIDANPDLVLYEPLTLNDNGVVRIEDSHDNLDYVVERVGEINPEVSFIIQPPHPLFGANYYPEQVKALKKYAEEKNYPYLDHWKAWPDQDDEALKEYLSEDSSTPSKKGHEVWAEFLIDYFIDEGE